MASPLFNAFGNGGMPSRNPLSNLGDFLTRFNQFRQTFNGDPRTQIQQMIDSGQITQEQFNQTSYIAKQIMQLIGK